MISESISLAAYHHHLLETLRIHSSKLERTRPASASPDDPEDVARQNSQDLFGIVFLMIIRFYSLDEQTMQSLSSGTASQIQAKLTSLLEALDGSANVDLNGSQKDNPRKQGFIPIGPYRRLEEALNCLSLSKAQVPIAASTSRSLFQFQSDGDISEAQRSALDLTTALMDSEKLCRASCGAEIVPTVTRLDGNTGRNILSRLESSFRTPISKMLDMIQAGFSNCLDHSPDRHHQILLRLLDAQGLVGTEDDLIFDLLLFCPSPNQWQHTCCNWLTIQGSHSVLNAQKRLCQLIKSSLSHLERLDLSFGKSTEFKPAKIVDYRNNHVLNAKSRTSLKHLINESRAFDPPSSMGNPRPVFNHRQRRLLAASLGMNLLVFYSCHHTTKIWDPTEVVFFGLSTTSYEDGVPYVFCSSEAGTSPVIEADDDDDSPIPCFTLFAKILLELEYGRIETDPDHEFDAKNHHGYHEIKNFYRTKRDYRDLSRQAYLDAVESCLNFRRDYDRERSRLIARSETVDETCRRLIFTKIVSNILTDLKPTPKRPSRRGHTKEDSEDSDIDCEDFGPIETSVTWGSGYSQPLQSDQISTIYTSEQLLIQQSGVSKGIISSGHDDTTASRGSNTDGTLEPSIGSAPPPKVSPGRSRKRVRISTEDSQIIDNSNDSTRATIYERTPSIVEPTTRAYSEYTVAWICALDVELAAGLQVRDEKFHDSPPYYFGRIGRHNVVMTCLPAGLTGNNAAAATAARMQDKFSSLKHCVLVGIGGGVPSDEHDIRLGDVVVGMPVGEHGGVVQWDFGKIGSGGRALRTGTLNRPSDMLLHAVTDLRANSWTDESQLANHLRSFNNLKKFARPTSDVLYRIPVDGSATNVSKHVESMIADRPPRNNEDPQLWFGNIATGNSVIKDGPSRDRISRELGGILCFEMEAAGVLNIFPCLVVRGICDYADSQKNKIWQPYAAATAAACAKELLSSLSAAV